MKLEINEKLKTVSIWFSSIENPTDNLPKNIEQEIEKYKTLKYRICMYQSGNDDIKRNLLNLIMNNAY